MFRRSLVSLALALPASPALAHSEAGVAIDFMGGFMHPIFGPDHVIAMVAVGLWGAFLGAPAIWLLPVVFPLMMAVAGAFGVLGVPAIWLLPVVFPLMMAVAGAFGVLGVPLPGVEIGIAVSAIMLGTMVALAAKPPLWIAAVLVAAFAIFHGHAHGAELPVGADAVAFSMGFVVATGMLHVSGIAFGTLSRWPAGRIAVRVAGVVIALIGLAYLVRAI